MRNVEVQAVFRWARSGKWRRRKRGETASIVAGNPAVIWDHPGSSSVGGGMCMCMYAHVCPGAGGRQAGRQAGTEKHLLWTPGLAWSVYVCVSLQRAGVGVGMGCESLTGRQAGSKKHLLCILGLASI